LALKIVIDGYNLLNTSRELQRLANRDLESARGMLIRRLRQYRQHKPHDITVVFDGWRSGQPTESQYSEGQIKVVYSRRGERADEVIKRMSKEGGQSLVVVTSDRELAHYAKGEGATIISAGQFESRLQQAQSVPSPEPEEPEPRLHTKKKGPARRLSRQQRKIRLTLNKL